MVGLGRRKGIFPEFLFFVAWFAGEKFKKKKGKENNENLSCLEDSKVKINVKQNRTAK